MFLVIFGHQASTSDLHIFLSLEIMNPSGRESWYLLYFSVSASLNSSVSPSIKTPPPPPHSLLSFPLSQTPPLLCFLSSLPPSLSITSHLSNCQLSSSFFSFLHSEHYSLVTPSLLLSRRERELIKKQDSSIIPCSFPSPLLSPHPFPLFSSTSPSIFFLFPQFFFSNSSIPPSYFPVHPIFTSFLPCSLRGNSISCAVTWSHGQSGGGGGGYLSTGGAKRSGSDMNPPNILTSAAGTSWNTHTHIQFVNLPLIESYCFHISKSFLTSWLLFRDHKTFNFEICFFFF